MSDGTGDGRRPVPDVPPPPTGHWPLAVPAPAPGPGSVTGAAFGHAAVATDRVVGAGLGTSLAAIGVYLIGQLGLQLLAGLVLMASGILDPGALDPDQGGTALLGIVVASQLAGLIGVLGFLRLRGVILRDPIGTVRPLGRNVGIGVGLGLVAILGSTIVVSVLVALSGSEATPDQVLTGGLVETPGQIALAVVAAVVLAPVAEELLFRGLLHRSLRSRWRIVPATVVSSFLFAVVHVDVVLSQPLALVGLTLVGAVLAVAYERTGSLLVPIVIHAVHNAITIIAVVVTSRLDLDFMSLGTAALRVGTSG
jgi:uncharacterized protein